MTDVLEEALNKKRPAPPRKPPSPGSKRERLYALKEENAQLRDSLRLQAAGYTVELWEVTGTQELRDGFAARALVGEWGNHARALQRLGFRVVDENGKWVPSYVQMLTEKIFDTPGVKALLDRNFSTLDERWQRIIMRQAEIAELGTDEVSIRAASFLAKAEGYNKEKAPPASAVSLHVLVHKTGGATEVKAVQTIEGHGVLELLTHEPSDVGVAIETQQDLPKEFRVE